jgi:hypothetical protein
MSDAEDNDPGTSRYHPDFNRDSQHCWDCDKRLYQWPVPPFRRPNWLFGFCNAACHLHYLLTCPYPNCGCFEWRQSKKKVHECPRGHRWVVCKLHGGKSLGNDPNGCACALRDDNGGNNDTAFKFSLDEEEEETKVERPKKEKKKKTKKPETNESEESVPMSGKQKTIQCQIYVFFSLDEEAEQVDKGTYSAGKKRKRSTKDKSDEPTDKKKKKRKKAKESSKKKLNRLLKKMKSQA